jgi:hypothetical protein
MASEDSRYRFSISVKLEEEGKAEPPMMMSDTIYNGLDYPSVLAIERLLIGMQEKLASYGDQIVQQMAKKP